MLGFLIAAAAGFVAPYLDAPVAQPIANAMRKKTTLESGELRLVSFMVALVAAAILAQLFDSGNAMTISVGVIVGYFAIRLLAVIKSAIDGRADT